MFGLIQTLKHLKQTQPTRERFAGIGRDPVKQAKARYFFENRQISKDFNPDGTAPVTESREQLTEINTSTEKELLREVLTDMTVKVGVNCNGQLFNPGEFTHLVVLSVVRARFLSLAREGEFMQPKHMSTIMQQDFKYKKLPSSININGSKVTGFVHQDAPLRFHGSKNIKLCRSLLREYYLNGGEKIVKQMAI